MSKRHRDAVGIQQGAGNPIAICNSIIAGVREVYENRGGTDTAYADPALRLMVHQLAFLFNAFDVNDKIYVYDSLMSTCEKKASE